MQFNQLVLKEKRTIPNTIIQFAMQFNQLVLKDGM